MSHEIGFCTHFDDKCDSIVGVFRDEKKKFDFGIFSKEGAKIALISIFELDKPIETILNEIKESDLPEKLRYRDIFAIVKHLVKQKIGWTENDDQYDAFIEKLCKIFNAKTEEAEPCDFVERCFGKTIYFVYSQKMYRLLSEFYETSTKADSDDVEYEICDLPEDLMPEDLMEVIEKAVQEIEEDFTMYIHPLFKFPIFPN